MAKSAYQLFREGKDPAEIGNPQLRQQVRRLQQQNYQQQLQQVNANYQAWRAENTDTQGNVAPIADYFAQVNAAKPANQQYIVKDGDTLPAIAERAGTTIPDLLSANPDMTAPQTGMVLNAPRPRPATNRPQNISQAAPFNRYAAATPAQLQAYGSTLGNTQSPGGNPFAAQPNAMFQTRPAGGFGLPSNAALGAATPNPQGFNFWDALKSGFQQIQNIGKLPGQGSQPQKSFQAAQAITTPTTSTPLQPSSTASQNQPSLIGGLPNAAGISQKNLTASALRLMEKVSNPDYTPTPAEIQALLRHRLLKPSSSQANGGLYGNYSYSSIQNRRKGYGGGGGGGTRTGGGGPQYTQRYNPENNLPAFSGGGGFRGLVNWRI